MNEDYMFYALNVDGRTLDVFKTPTDAINELSEQMYTIDSLVYEIEPLDSIWKMLERLSDINDRYDDEWMKKVLRIASAMVFGDDELHD